MSHGLKPTKRSDKRCSYLSASAARLAALPVLIACVALASFSAFPSTCPSCTSGANTTRVPEIVDSAVIMTRTDTSHPFPAVVALVLVLVPCGCADGYDHAHDAVVRSLHNAEVDTGIWIADFTNLPERMDESFTPYTITEVQLRSTASAHIVTKPDHQQGAYAVGALQAEQLGLAVAAELVRRQSCPALGSLHATTVSTSLRLC